MGQAQINVRTRACSRTSIAALTHNVRGKELNVFYKVSKSECDAATKNSFFSASMRPCYNRAVRQ